MRVRGRSRGRRPRSDVDGAGVAAGDGERPAKKLVPDGLRVFARLREAVRAPALEGRARLVAAPCAYVESGPVGDDGLERNRAGRRLFRLRLEHVLELGERAHPVAELGDPRLDARDPVNLCSRFAGELLARDGRLREAVVDEEP